MGAIGYALSVGGDGDIDAFRSDVWEAMRGLVECYITGPEYGELRSYLDHLDPVDDQHRAGDPTAYWWFPDLGGCDRSASSWLHWFGLVVAVDWQRIRYLARKHGVTITQERPERGERAPAGDRFVVLRGDLWQIQPDGLYGDDARLLVGELTRDELSAYEAARDLCSCGVCDRLRPDDDVFAATLAELREAGFRGAVTAAAVLSRMNRTTPEVLESIILAPARMDGQAFQWFSDPAEACARMLPDAWEQLMALTQTVTDHGSYYLVLETLESLYFDDEERQAARKAAFVAELRAGADPVGRWYSELAGIILVEIEREEGPAVPAS